MDSSLAIDPKKLPNNINEKFCEINDDQRIVATTENGFSKSVVKKILSRSCDDLSWIDDGKAKFTPNSLRIKNERYLFLCIAFQ